MTWTITKIEYLPEVEGVQKVISKIHWYYDEVKNGFATIEFNPEEPFIDFDNVTEAMAIQWVKDYLGTQAVYEIENQVVPEPETVIVTNPFGE
jgi:hypothetical protein